MVMFSNGEITFMYRVGGIALHEGRLLVEHNLRHGFSFVPGGRVEYGENAIQALSRELQEEFGGDVQYRAARLSSPTTCLSWTAYATKRLACIS